MRLSVLLLAAVAAMGLVGCGDEGETAAPLPVAQRFVTAADAPGSKPDPVETRQTTADFDEFIAALTERAVNPDKKEMTTVFKEAGFKDGGADARYFGAVHSPGVPHVFSSEIELASEDGAASALDWLEADAMKPCPMSCAVQREAFDVDDIPDARGVRRSATAEDIQAMGSGAGDEHPFDSYWVGFTVGPVVYTMELHGDPGSVSEEQAQQIASAYYERLSGG